MASDDALPALHVVALLRGFANGAFPASSVDASAVLDYAFEQAAIGLSVLGDPAMAGTVLAQVESERIGAGIQIGCKSSPDSS
jgi:hypothetical protein